MHRTILLTLGLLLLSACASESPASSGIDAGTDVGTDNGGTGDPTDDGTGTGTGTEQQGTEPAGTGQDTDPATTGDTGTEPGFDTNEDIGCQFACVSSNQCLGAGGTERPELACAVDGEVCCEGVTISTDWNPGGDSTDTGNCTFECVREWMCALTGSTLHDEMSCGGGMGGMQACCELAAGAPSDYPSTDAQACDTDVYTCMRGSDCADQGGAWISANACPPNDQGRNQACCDLSSAPTDLPGDTATM